MKWFMLPYYFMWFLGLMLSIYFLYFLVVTT